MAEQKEKKTTAFLAVDESSVSAQELQLVEKLFASRPEFELRFFCSDPYGLNASFTSIIVMGFVTSAIRRRGWKIVLSDFCSLTMETIKAILTKKDSPNLVVLVEYAALDVVGLFSSSNVGETEEALSKFGALTQAADADLKALRELSASVNTLYYLWYEEDKTWEIFAASKESFFLIKYNRAGRWNEINYDYFDDIADEPYLFALEDYRSWRGK